MYERSLPMKIKQQKKRKSLDVATLEFWNLKNTSELINVAVNIKNE